MVVQYNKSNYPIQAIACIAVALVSWYIMCGLMYSLLFGAAVFLAVMAAAVCRKAFFNVIGIVGNLFSKKNDGAVLQESSVNQRQHNRSGSSEDDFYRLDAEENAVQHDNTGADNGMLHASKKFTINATTAKLAVSIVTGLMAASLMYTISEVSMILSAVCFIAMFNFFVYKDNEINRRFDKASDRVIEFLSDQACAFTHRGIKFVCDKVEQVSELVKKSFSQPTEGV